MEKPEGVYKTVFGEVPAVGETHTADHVTHEMVDGTSPPDRLSVEKDSPFFDMDVAREVRVFLNGQEQVGKVAEYCVSEGWVRRYVGVRPGKFKAERGKNLAFKSSGVVEVKWK